MQRTILVVDDDPHIRQLLVFALAKVGLEAREAADGEAALASVAERAPDLVVLDINMPRLDGLEVCRRLRAQGDLPILFLSSRDDDWGTRGLERTHDTSASPESARASPLPAQAP